MEDGSAKAALQQFFDRHGECAPVLDFDKASGFFTARPDNRQAAETLVRAGLIEAAPGPAREDRTYYRPAPAAKRWFKRQNAAGPTENQLRFARRRIRDVALQTDGTSPEWRYTFDLVDPAPWMKRPYMRAAFPMVALAVDYKETLYAARRPVLLDGDKPKLDSMIFSPWEDGPFPTFGVDFSGDSTAGRVQSNATLYSGDR